MGLDVDDNGYEDKLLTTDLFAEIQGVGYNPYKIVSCLDLQAPVMVQATTGKICSKNRKRYLAQPFKNFSDTKLKIYTLFHQNLYGCGLYPSF